MQPTTLSQAPKTEKDTNPHAQTRIALIGDSITELTKYPYYVMQSLGPSYLVGNFGVCGTTISLDSESAYMHSNAFVEAANFKPKIAVVMLGTNDANLSLKESYTNFVEDYLVLIEKLQMLKSKPKVWIVKPPPIFNEILGYSTEGLAKGVNPAIEEVARRANVAIIDVYSALTNSQYFLDGVHPNDEGAKIIACVICQAIILK
jgi:lysophospholipase L1-like esterase